MKRKVRLLLAVILAMTMVMGIGVTAFTEEKYELSISGEPQGTAYMYFPDDIVSGQNVTFVRFGTSETKSSYIGVKNTDNYSFFSNTNNFNPVPQKGECYYYQGDERPYYRHATNASVRIISDPIEPTQKSSSASAHVHSFTWQTIYEATPNSDGLEGEVCSCGATRNTQPISAMDYAINKYAEDTIRVAKPGQKITLEFGEFNSFPRYMMEKVAARMNENITFVFKFKQNKKMQTVTIEPGTAIDLQYDWYGPDKMKELYGAE